MNVVMFFYCWLKLHLYLRKKNQQSSSFSLLDKLGKKIQYIDQTEFNGYSTFSTSWQQANKLAWKKTFCSQLLFHIIFFDCQIRLLVQCSVSCHLLI